MTASQKKNKNKKKRKNKNRKSAGSDLESPKSKRELSTSADSLSEGGQVEESKVAVV